MALRLEDKKQIVAEVADVAKQAASAVAADYRGLGVAEMTDLRAQARQKGIYLRVVRNTLARRALAGSPYECLSEALVGPLVLAFSQDEPGAAARLIRDFSKDHEKLEVKALSLGESLLDASQLAAVAKLPSKDEAIAKLLSVMQAPVAKFVRTLAAPNSKLVRTLAAVRDQKQTAA